MCAYRNLASFVFWWRREGGSHKKWFELGPIDPVEKEIDPKVSGPSLSSDANVSKGSNYSSLPLWMTCEITYISALGLFGTFNSRLNKKNVPSRRMPTLRHFLRRQYWHWLRWCWSIGHDLKLALSWLRTKQKRKSLPAAAARVVQVAPNRTLEKALAALASKLAIMLPRWFIAAHLNC